MLKWPTVCQRQTAALLLSDVHSASHNNHKYLHPPPTWTTVGAVDSRLRVCEQEQAGLVCSVLILQKLFVLKLELIVTTKLKKSKKKPTPNSPNLQAGLLGEFGGVGFFFMRKFVTLEVEVHDVTIFNGCNAIGTTSYSGSTVSLTSCTFSGAHAGHWPCCLFLEQHHRVVQEQFKNCTFVGASPGHNSIAQDGSAKVICSWCPSDNYLLST